MPEQGDVRAVRWTFTLNNYSIQDINELKNLPCKYLIMGREHVNGEGTPHLQGYVVFSSQKRFSTLHRFNERIHWEKAVRGHTANITYCSKEDPEPIEIGERPKDRNLSVDLNALAVDPKNAVSIINGTRYLHGINIEREIFECVSTNSLEKPEIIYIHGSSGTGKTYYAIKDAAQKYGPENCSFLRFANSFATCNNPHADALILPEFRPSSVDAATFLEFTDCYGMVLNIKHSHVYIKPKAIYICSIKHPTEIYKDEINQQFIRRITKFIDKDEEPYTQPIN